MCYRKETLEGVADLIRIVATTVGTIEDTTIIKEEDSIITISIVEITTSLIVEADTIITVEEMAKETQNPQIVAKLKIEIPMVQILLGRHKIQGKEGILEDITGEEDKGMSMGNIEAEEIATGVAAAEEEEAMADITRQATKETNNNYTYVRHIEHPKSSTK